jgi:antibiotic biosynthesis monooxygenase (ABM) superfamily enzyme
MAVVTLLGVYPVSLLIGCALSPQLRKLPLGLNLLIVSVLIVTCLTWLVMPRLTRWFKPWLNSQPKDKETHPSYR